MGDRVFNRGDIKLKPEVDSQKLVQQIASASSLKEIEVYLFRSNSTTRSLELTWEAIRLNPLNTWVWVARRDLLELGYYSELHKEYDLIASLPIELNEVWIHRRRIAEKLGVDALRKEFEFTMDNLVKYPLHQCAWLNMRLLSGKFRDDFQDKEHSLTTSILSADLENRHAWSHKWFMTFKLEASALRLEVEWVKDILLKNATNTHAWSYMVMLGRELQDGIISDLLKFVDVILLDDGNNVVAWRNRQSLARDGFQTGIDILSHELEYTEVILSKDAKNGYGWAYRRWVLEKMGKDASSSELRFTDMILSKDSNNEHAWHNRQWLCEKYGGEVKEHACSDKCLENDIFNEYAPSKNFALLMLERLKATTSQGPRGLDVYSSPTGSSNVKRSLIDVLFKHISGYM